MKINKKHLIDWKINQEPNYLQIGKIRIVLETGNIEFLEGYNPNETAKQFWEFIAQYKPKFLEQEKQKWVEEIEKEIEKMSKNPKITNVGETFFELSKLKSRIKNLFTPHTG